MSLRRRYDASQESDRLEALDRVDLAGGGRIGGGRIDSGHSSSAILDLYFTMNDRHAQAAMNGMSFDSEAESKNRTDVAHSLP